jgi:hypothetical protein
MEFLPVGTTTIKVSQRIEDVGDDDFTEIPSCCCLDSAYIFVGGLPYKATEGDVIQIFSQWVRYSSPHLDPLLIGSSFI